VSVQICALLNGDDNNGWTTVWLNEQAVPYMYRDQQWVAYDNVDSVTYKAILSAIITDRLQTLD